MTTVDMVNHPPHYTSGPKCECGRTIECITIARGRQFTIGSAFKYLWRLGLKDDAALSAVDKEIQDAEKAIWYIQDHVTELKKLRAAEPATHLHVVT